jgi:hypothetical protein
MSPAVNQGDSITGPLSDYQRRMTRLIPGKSRYSIDRL